MSELRSAGQIRVSLLRAHQMYQMAETELPVVGLCGGSRLCSGNWETSAASQARVEGEGWAQGLSWGLYTRQFLLEPFQKVPPGSTGSVICLERGGLYAVGELAGERLEVVILEGRRASWQERHGRCEIQDFGILKCGSIVESTFSSFSEHLHIYVHLKLHIYGSLYRWTYMIINIRFYIY